MRASHSSASMRERVCGPVQAAVAHACSARIPPCAGHRRGDGVGERQRLVVGAARSAAVQVRGRAGGRPSRRAGRSDSCGRSPPASGSSPWRRTCSARSMRASARRCPAVRRVGVAGFAGQRFQGGQERFAVFGGEAEPAEQAAVGLAAVGEVALVPGAGVVGFEGGFAVGGDLVRDPHAELVRVHRRGDGDQVRLGLDQPVRVDLADQAGQDRRLRRGEDAVQDGGGDQRQVAQQPGGPQLRSGGAGGGVLDLREPAGDGAGPAGVGVGHAPAGELVEPAGGGGQPALQPADLRRDAAICACRSVASSWSSGAETSASTSGRSAVAPVVVVVLLVVAMP